ncbi:nucleotidyl transferase AbiEii/AbiGii toxin family protein [Butyrivibrio sp. XB500-5]|nr:nucleotidyl transferase AbiEii/AbiGii toxin family protein [Butyrivibrio sp. XB500-5]
MPQEVLQMFFLERVLERLSRSNYSRNFILKGGMLISSMLGVMERTTMDMDTTVNGISMAEDEIAKIIKQILKIDIGDGIKFEFEKLEPIREDDDYNNYRAYFTAIYGKIANKMKIDITTGDVITPGAINYSYKTILDDDKIDVLAYNCETILAEKYETIIRRNIGTTRARDFYDLHVFYQLYSEDIDFGILQKAIRRTSQKRDSEEILSEWKDICVDMRRDEPLRALWKNYQDNNKFAEKVSFDSTLDTVEEISLKTHVVDYLKKAVFLDVDGVLNSNNNDYGAGVEISDGKLVDSKAVALLAKLVKETDATIILHSGWRFWFDDEMNPTRPEAEYLVSSLEKEGIRISGVTPDLTTEEIRKTKKFSLVKAEEILQWLKLNKEYTNWVVLDDLDLHNAVVEAHQVKTDPKVGLTENDIRRAMDILGE